MCCAELGIVLNLASDVYVFVEACILEDQAIGPPLMKNTYPEQDLGLERSCAQSTSEQASWRKQRHLGGTGCSPACLTDSEKHIVTLSSVPDPTLPDIFVTYYLH